MLTPYYSWKISHHRHHMYHNTLEEDVVYVPHTRSEWGVPADIPPGHSEYDEYLGDAPLYTLLRLVAMQLFAWPAYLRTSL